MGTLGLIWWVVDSVMGPEAAQAGVPSTPWCLHLSTHHFHASSSRLFSFGVFSPFLPSLSLPSLSMLPSAFPIFAVLWNVRSFKVICFVLRLWGAKQTKCRPLCAGLHSGAVGWGLYFGIFAIRPAFPFSQGQKGNWGCQSSLEVQPELGPLVIWVISESKILHLANLLDNPSKCGFHWLLRKRPLSMH